MEVIIPAKFARVSIVDTIIIYCNHEIASKLAKIKVEPEFDFTIGAEFSAKSGNTIRAKRTIFRKFPNWYFHITDFLPGADIILIDNSTEVENLIKEKIMQITKFNRDHITYLGSNPYLKIHGVGLKTGRKLFSDPNPQVKLGQEGDLLSIDFSRCLNI